MSTCECVKPMPSMNLRMLDGRETQEEAVNRQQGKGRQWGRKRKKGIKHQEKQVAYSLCAAAATVTFSHTKTLEGPQTTYLLYLYYKHSLETAMSRVPWKVLKHIGEGGWEAFLREFRGRNGCYGNKKGDYCLSLSLWWCIASWQGIRRGNWVTSWWPKSENKKGLVFQHSLQ